MKYPGKALALSLAVMCLSGAKDSKTDPISQPPSLEAVIAQQDVDANNLQAGQVAIDEMVWELPGGFRHHFWRMTTLNEQGQPVLLDIHGMATDKDTAVVRPIGTPENDVISVWLTDPLTDGGGGLGTRQVNRMAVVDSLTALQYLAAIGYIGAEINSTNTPYRAINTGALFSGNLTGMTVTDNSNAVFSTLGLVMGFGMPEADFLAPGLGTSLLYPETEIAYVRSQAAGVTAAESGAIATATLHQVAANLPRKNNIDSPEYYRELEEFMERRTAATEAVNNFTTALWPGLER